MLPSDTYEIRLDKSRDVRTSKRGENQSSRNNEQGSVASAEMVGVRVRFERPGPIRL